MVRGGKVGCVEVGAVGAVGFVLEMHDLMVIMMGTIGDGLHENMQIWNEIESGGEGGEGIIGCSL